MGRLLVLVVVGAGVFSFLAFQKGGVLPGILLALVAIAPIAYLIAAGQRRRANGGAPVPWSANAKKVIAGVTVVLLLGLAYSAYWTFRVPKAATKALDYNRQLDDLCNTPPTFYKDAAAYTGSGPHPVMVFAKADDVGLDAVDLDDAAPAQWRPQLDGTTVQLVACLDSVDSGPKITDCRFSDGSVPLYQGRYKGTLFEARTGKKVASIAVDGVTTPTCPGAAVTKGDAPRLHSVPDLAALRAAFGDRVDR